MLEKDMEELIIAFPGEFIEDGLIFVGNQVRVKTGRIDILYETKFGELLVVEVKRRFQRKDISQVLDYFGAIKGKYPERSVQCMIIANHISKEHRITLDNYDIGYREIPKKKFVEVAKKNNFNIEPKAERNSGACKREISRRKDFNPGDNTTLKECVHQICGLQPKRVKGMTTNHPVALEIKEILSNTAEIIGRKLADQGVEYSEIRISEGQGNFSSTPWVDILPHGQEPKDGIFPGLIFDKQGRGVVFGCMESVDNRKGLYIKRCSVLDVVRYNKAFTNPMEVMVDEFDEKEFFEYLNESFYIAIREIEKREVD